MYNFTHNVYFYTQGVILHNDLRCFVARQFLSRIYALSSVKISGLKMCECKKMTNMRYGQRFTIILSHGHCSVNLIFLQQLVRELQISFFFHSIVFSAADFQSIDCRLKFDHHLIHITFTILTS